MRSHEKEILTKTKKKKKHSIIIDIIFIVLSIFSSIYLIYNLLLLGPIEKILRYVLIGIICLFDFLLILNLFRKKKKKNMKKVIKRFCLLLLIIAYFVIGYNINIISGILGNMNKKYITTSSSLVTLKDNELDKVEEIRGAKIAIGNNAEDTESYIIPREIIDKYSLDKDNEIIEYEDYQSMIRDLYNGTVMYVFLPTNYVSIYGQMEEYETLEDDTKILTSLTKEETKQEMGLLGSSKDISEPFTILLLGLDSKTDGIKNADSFNGDAMILVTFNPKTLTATMLSIPRDTYVPISCFPNNTENKITHAASRGTKCVIDTIQNFFGIDIDYYAKINFTGLVDLVDALGGIDVDVPFALCEQDSLRRWGNNTVYIEKGLQHLNGEQALALSRNRKKDTKNHKKCGSKYLQGTRNDFVRGQNQQLVVKGLVNAAKKIDKISTVYDILDTISNNMDTNMSRGNILSFYNIAKDIMLSSHNNSDDLVTIKKLYLAGADQMIYDERSNLVLYNYIPNGESKELIIKAMKENLGLVKSETTKTFAYSIENTYSSNTIGRYPKSGTKLYNLLPNFTSYSKVEADAWALKNDFTIVYKEVESTKYEEGKIISQSYHEKKRLDLCSDKKITLEIVVKPKSSTTDKEDEESTDKNKNDKQLEKNNNDRI